MGATGLTSVLGALAGGLAVVALFEAVRAAPVLMRVLDHVIEPVRRTRAEGHVPTERERRRLSILAAAALGGLAIFLDGVGPVALISVAGPALAGWLLTRRRRAYIEGVNRDLPAVARALADSLGSGRSMRAALMDIPAALSGPAAAELARVAAELSLGGSLQSTLGAFRRRMASPRVDALASALLSQRLAGGDVVDLLRRFAAACDSQDRASRDARTETAQARFTGLLVVAMPAGAALFGELVSPGAIGKILREPLTLSMVGLAVSLQLIGFLAIGRLARVDR